MVTIGMNYSVLQGKEEVFEGACDKVLTVMSDAEGHDDSQIFRRRKITSISPFSLFLCCISGFAEPQDPWEQRNSRSSVGSIIPDRLLQK